MASSQFCNQIIGGVVCGKDVACGGLDCKGNIQLFCMRCWTKKSGRRCGVDKERTQCSTTDCYRKTTKIYESSTDKKWRPICPNCMIDIININPFNTNQNTKQNATKMKDEIQREVKEKLQKEFQKELDELRDKLYKNEREKEEKKEECRCTRCHHRFYTRTYEGDTPICRQCRDQFPKSNAENKKRKTEYRDLDEPDDFLSFITDSKQARYFELSK